MEGAPRGRDCAGALLCPGSCRAGTSPGTFTLASDKVSPSLGALAGAAAAGTAGGVPAMQGWGWGGSEPFPPKPACDPVRYTAAFQTA